MRISADGPQGVSEGALFDDNSLGDNRRGSTSGDNTTVRIDASRVVPTATENRPVNIAVKYLIKAA